MGRMGTSQVAVRELAVRFQSQCGSGSIPAMCCCICFGCHTVLSTREGTRPCPAPKSEPVALAHNRIPARVLSTSLSATALAGTTDDVSETLTTVTMPAVYCGCGQDKDCENTTVAARMSTRLKWYLEELGRGQSPRISTGLSPSIRLCLVHLAHGTKRRAPCAPKRERHCQGESEPRQTRTVTGTRTWGSLVSGAHTFQD